MLRSPRTTASLIRTLLLAAPPSLRPVLLSTAAATTAATLATTLVGCKDEGQPEYWVDKLEDRAWRPRAIKRLEQFFEDAITRANKDMSSPEVQGLADKILEPLVETYVSQYADLDDKTRGTLIKLVASFRDPRTEPALKAAFDQFAKRGKGAEDVRWASRAAGNLKLPGLAEPMLMAFDKLKASTQEGRSAYRDLNEAMLAAPSASWSGLLKQKLDAEIKLPGKDKEPAAIEEYQNQLFWQTTAAQLLGELKVAEAVEPLLKVMLDPAKADVHTTAVLALVKIGKPAVDRALKVLADQDEAMALHAAARTQKATGAKEPPKDKPHIATAALILGVIGRQDAIGPMIAAAKATKDETVRAIIARELAKIPATSASKQAFQDAFESISIDTVIPPGASALQTLAESAGQFYDPEMIGWLLGRAEATKGSGDDKKALQSAITVTAIKLMKPDQLSQVNGAVKKYGTKIEQDAFAQASELVKACGDRTSCYLAAIEKSENQERNKQFVGIKAGYMLGIYGDEKTRDEIIERLDAIENAAVRFTASQTIDFLSPKGSTEAADALKKLIDKNAKSADRAVAQADAPLRQVMHRIRSRAQ